MDIFENKSGGVEAKLRYLDADISVISAGSFVTCAISKKPILVNELKYWNVDRQEAYIDADAAMRAYLKYKD